MSYLIQVRENMESPLRVTRDATRVIWAKAKRWRCRLIFEDRKRFYWGYKLSRFLEFILSSGLFIRVHDSHVVRKDAIAGYKYGMAQLCNGKMIPVTRAMRQTVKEMAALNMRTAK